MTLLKTAFNIMKEMWDKRYGKKEYAYGKTPNEFFKSTLEKYLIQGSILLPAEGEGRNAVYAAKQGLEVTAFDISNEGKKKALHLATAEDVSINYIVGDFLEMDFPKNHFNAAALIYAHFLPNLIKKYHQKISTFVKPGGFIILEGFSKNNLQLRQENHKVGGPNRVDMLFSTEQTAGDFPGFKILELVETEVELKEGSFHNGLASVIRFVGKKL